MKVTECWTVKRPGQDNPDAARATHYKCRDDRPAVLMWAEDYNALKVLSDCLLMVDGYLANDSQMDDALMQKALKMADVFKTAPSE